MNYQTIFKRYEMKYLITKAQQQLLSGIMEEYMEPDYFGKSTIRNIYFDTPAKLLIRRSCEKPIYKEKLRIRSYDAATAQSTVFIELKKKYLGVVYKRRIDMPCEAAMKYLCEQISPDHETQIQKEIDYFYSLYQNIEPSIFLAYEREAFFGKKDSSFRMTFDENVLFRDYDLSLQSNIYGQRLLDPEVVILEVKTAMGLPLWLTGFLSKSSIYKTSFSKYGSTYQEMLLHGYKGGTAHVAC